MIPPVMRGLVVMGDETQQVVLQVFPTPGTSATRRTPAAPQLVGRADSREKEQMRANRWRPPPGAPRARRAPRPPSRSRRKRTPTARPPSMTSEVTRASAWTVRFCARCGRARERRATCCNARPRGWWPDGARRPSCSAPLKSRFSRTPSAWAAACTSSWLIGLPRRRSRRAGRQRRGTRRRRASCSRSA